MALSSGESASEESEVCTVAEYDRYGFRQARTGDAVADSSRAYARWFEPKERRRLMRFETRRQRLAAPGKWMDMNHKTLKALLRKGLPSEHRSEVWWDILGCDLQRNCSSRSYNDYLALPPPPRTEEEIERDLHRTFPNHRVFCTEAGRGNLRNVLRAFAVHSPTILYCQGLNYIAAMFLIVFSDEESAFWALVCSIARLGVDGYYVEGMPLLRADINVLQQLMSKKCAKVAQHLKERGVDLMSLCSEWFVTWFAKSHPVPTTLRVWDTLFFEGYKVLFRISIGVFKRVEQEILRCADFESIMERAKQWPGHMVEHNELIKAGFFGVSHFRRRDLQQFRDVALIGVEQEDVLRRKRVEETRKRMAREAELRKSGAIDSRLGGRSNDERARTLLESAPTPSN